MKPAPDWQAAWADYRNRRVVSYLVLLGGIGAMVAMSPGTPPFFVVAFILGVTFAFHHKWSFPCPRCGNPFGVRKKRYELSDFRGAWWWQFTGCCLHCGIGVGEDPTRVG